MRFKCGPTYEEKIAAQYQWHRKFVFFPKSTINGVCVWLEFVDRRISDYRYNWAGETIEYEYRLRDTKEAM